MATHGNGAQLGLDTPANRMATLLRVFQRYLIPGFVGSIYFWLRDRALVSPSANVQVTRRIRFGRGTVVKTTAIVHSSPGNIVVGADCAISSFDYITAGTADVVVGDNVRIGPHVSILGTTREYRRKDRLIVEQGFRDKGIKIGNDVLIGSHAVLVDGCEIGDGAVIGVGSVVTGKVEPYSVVFGAPAKVVFWRR